jgi:hypothetical protein
LHTLIVGFSNYAGNQRLFTDYSASFAGKYFTLLLPDEIQRAQIFHNGNYLWREYITLVLRTDEAGFSG